MTPRTTDVLLLLGAAALVILSPAGGLPDLPLADPFLPPGGVHPLGTDDLGRDMLHATAQGLRTSVLVGLGTTILALGLGFAVGLAAGLSDPPVDDLLMRATDVVAGLPTLLVAIMVAALFGGSVVALTLVLGATRWPLVARLARVEAQALRAREFVLAARALGRSRGGILVHHVLPQVTIVARSAAGILFGGALVSEAALAFVGLGDPARTSLGQLAANGFRCVVHAPWTWAAPVGAIVALAVAVAILADRPPRAG
ncbi:MAG: ABC transporter permease [Rhodospirillales bacterium]